MLEEVYTYEIMIALFSLHKHCSILYIYIMQIKKDLVSVQCFLFLLLFSLLH